RRGVRAKRASGVEITGEALEDRRHVDAGVEASEGERLRPPLARRLHLARAVGEAPDLLVAAEAGGMAVERVLYPAEPDTRRDASRAPLGDEVQARVRREGRIAPPRHEELLDRLVVGGLGIDARGGRLFCRRHGLRLRSQMSRSPVSVSTGSTASIEGTS